MTALSNMTEMQALLKADRIIELLIQHQPGLFAHGLLHSDTTATRAGKALAQLRQSLIAELMQQPGPSSS